MEKLTRIIAAVLIGTSCTNHRANYQDIVDTYQKIIDTQSGLIKDLERENDRLRQKPKEEQKQKPPLKYPWTLDNTL